jgi:hypothetical protein
MAVRKKSMSSKRVRKGERGSSQSLPHLLADPHHVLSECPHTLGTIPLVVDGMAVILPHTVESCRGGRWQVRRMERGVCWRVHAHVCEQVHNGEVREQGHASEGLQIPTGRPTFSIVLEDAARDYVAVSSSFDLLHLVHLHQLIKAVEEPGGWEHKYECACWNVHRGVLSED